MAGGGALLAADIAVRAALVGLPPYFPARAALVYVVEVFVDDALVFFGMTRLAQIVGQVERAQYEAANLAVAQERLRAAQVLQTAVGGRLAGIAATTAAASRVLPDDAARARAQVAAARTAVAQARAVTLSGRSLPRPQVAATRKVTR